MVTSICFSKIKITYRILTNDQVYYYLGELDDALTYALGSEDLLDVSENSEYTDTILSKCVDQYVDLQQKLVDSKTDQIEPADSRLIAMVERMFSICLDDRKYQQAVGLAIECRRCEAPM